MARPKYQEGDRVICRYDRFQLHGKVVLITPKGLLLQGCHGDPDVINEETLYRVRTDDGACRDYTVKELRREPPER